MAGTDLVSRWAPLVLHGAPLAEQANRVEVRSAAPTVTLPDQWLKRLFQRLVKQQKQWKFFDDYYRGEHPLPWLPTQAREEFRRILRMTRSNYMGLVVDAQVERMILEGFRVGDAKDADEDLWRVWRANSMDADLDLGLLESAKCGSAYLMVGPNPDDQKTPIMSVEHPTQVAVAVAPGHRRALDAGLKMWRDEWTGQLVARLYLPEYVVPYRAKAVPAGGTPRFERDGDVQLNPLGEVPLWELPNNPVLLSGGRSELDDLTDIQDRINKTIADRLMTQDFGAFPQKWGIGYPDEDADIDVGRNRMVTTSVSKADALFGQWDAAPLDPYSAAKREDVKDIASRSRTPAQYLLGEMSNVNGETLKASESGLVAKVRQRVRPHSETLEGACKAVRRLAGMAEAGSSIESVWRNPEFRTEGELVDALVKMSTLGVPREALWERWGASPTEIDRWREMAENDPEVQAMRGLAGGPA